VATILIGDDDHLVVRLLGFTLGEGHRLLEARDGRAAMDLVARERPDLVVLDVRLPELNGIAACERIKGDVTTRAVRVLMVTASNQATDRDRARAAGADGFLTKPFSPFRFLAIVEELLRHEACAARW
jgi:CheY-like chemotaxis protein